VDFNEYILKNILGHIPGFDSTLNKAKKLVMVGFPETGEPVING
jgi:hypothetical protein